MIDTPNSFLAANPQLILAGGVYQDTKSQIRETSLSHYLRTFTRDIFTSTQDLSLFSIELEQAATTDELKDAFSPAPYNHLLALTLPALNNALDLTQDLGGVSHFLSAKATHIDSVKIDIGRASLASLRTESLNNVTHISDDLSTLNLPKSYFDLIVLGELNELGLSSEDFSSFLKRLKDALTPDGCLVLVSDNKNRVNKCLSQGDSSIPYLDLYLEKNIINVGQLGLKELLLTSDIAHANLFASFSSGHKVSNLFAQDYLSNYPYAVNHFNRIGVINNDDLNEYLLFKNMPEPQLYFDQASRYVAIIGNDLASVNALCQTNFAHFPGTSRKAQWRTVTACERGTNQVTKTPLLNETQRFELLSQLSDTPKLVQDISNKKFHQGPLLLDEWLAAALHNDVKLLRKLIAEYSDWLKSLENQGDFCDSAYDLLPFNIIIEDDRTFKSIDSEWQLKAEYSADFVLFRALFWFAFENRTILKPFANTTKLTSIGLFVCHFMDGIEDVSDLQTFVVLEENVQRQISHSFRKKSVEFALNQLFNSNNKIVKSGQPACQLSWGNSEQVYDEANSVFIEWNKSKQPQQLSSELSALSDNTILRIDPIASTGIFHFSAVTLRDQQQKCIWQLDSSDQILSSSSQQNLSAITNKEQATSFIALNDDPYFLFDLSSVKNLNDVASIELSFALVHDENYDNALATLSHIVNEQNSALVEQANGINEKLAQVDVLQAELKHLSAHRADLKSALNETQQTSSAQIEQLSQHVNNLEHAMMMRPMSRVKRLLRRLLRRG